MDKAMKALKDRRHIKSRKINGTKSQSQEAIKEAVETKRSNEKDPISTDSAGHALLLLRRNAEEGINKPRESDEDRTRMMPPPRMTDGQNFERRALQHSRHQESRGDNAEAQGISNLLRADSRSRVYQVSSSVAGRLGEANTGTAEKSKGPSIGGGPVLWQSVIVSRESPQASLADMLVNARQRLDALSSIQRAVSAPICLIYPPSSTFSLTGQVSLGQLTATQGPANQEFISMITRTGAPHQVS